MTHRMNQEWEDSLAELRAVNPAESERDDWPSDASPPRRVTLAEQREMTGAPSTWVDVHADRKEIVRRDQGGELQRVAGEIVRSVAEPPAQDATADAWRPLPTVREVGTPTHRAWATLIRAAPLVVLALPVSVGLVWALGTWWGWLLPVWGLISVAAYLCLVLLDLTYNAPSATERHRINKAAQVETLKARQAHELRRAIVEAWLDYMKGRDDAA